MLKDLIFPFPNELYLKVLGFLTKGILEQENVQVNSGFAL